MERLTVFALHGNGQHGRGLTMNPDYEPDTASAAAIRFYDPYRYTVVITANGPQAHTIEAELWYGTLDLETAGRWQYFRRRAAATTTDAVTDAVQLVENDFRDWARRKGEPAPEGRSDGRARL
jgi:hypothetical protein